MERLEVRIVMGMILKQLKGKKMEIYKYKIQNYKAVLETEIKLNYKINPIVGVNESGKTTILQAILAFDKNRDRFNSGNHLDYQNKYSTKQTKDSKITAYIRLTKNEKKELLEKLDVKNGTDEYNFISNLNESYNFILTRKLSNEKRDYSLENIDYPEIIKDKTEKFILKRLPFILYFDDFTDRVPDEIVFREDYKSTGRIAASRNKEWKEIIVEIFKRAEAEGIDDTEDPLKDFFKLENADRKEDILSDIEAVLNKEIIEEWKKIKKSGLANLADDSENLSIELKFDGLSFKFKVKDKSNEDRKRTFDVSERSKGFQWFFNYMIKLKFNPRYKVKQENSIFLLDEPGSYLHSSAQSELLKELLNVSHKNTIVYCTHSQFLLHPKIIKLGSIKIAEKEKSKIKLTEFGSYKVNNDKGALSAVYQALNLNFSKDFVDKIIITEGITDFHFIDMLRENTNLISNKFNIIPGSGSGNCTNLISIGLSFSENFSVLFDNDRGLNSIKKYKEEFGDQIEKYFYVYSNEKKFRLENFLDNEDRAKIKRLTNTVEVKKAISSLYHDYKEFQNNFFNSLNSESKKRINTLVQHLNSI